MNRHEHHECDHDTGYCKACDVAYCKKCEKEWRAYNYTYGSLTGTGVTYLNGTPTITCGALSATTFPGGGSANHTHAGVTQ